MKLNEKHCAQYRKVPSNVVFALIKYKELVVAAASGSGFSDSPKIQEMNS